MKSAPNEAAMVMSMLLGGIVLYPYIDVLQTNTLCDLWVARSPDV